MSSFYIPDSTRKIFLNKENNLRIFEVKNADDLEAKGEAYRRQFADKLAKVKIGKVGQIAGVVFWKVDGAMVRNLFDDDFVMGGHGYRYLYIPLNEIWIDNGAKKGDWPVFWHEYAERQNMSRGMNYSDAHDISSQIEITMRSGHQFALPVRHFEQEQKYSCGAASLRIVFDFFDDRLTEAEIIQLAKTSEENGTDAKDMVGAAKQLGYKVRWSEGWTPERVISSVKKGIPVIANFQHYSHNRGEGHYSVIMGFTDNQEFIVCDPAKPLESGGFHVVSISKFMEFWYEKDDNTSREGIAIKK